MKKNNMSLADIKLVEVSVCVASSNGFTKCDIVVFMQYLYSGFMQSCNMQVQNVNF